MTLLLLSNSRGADGRMLAHALTSIRALLAGVYAEVGKDFGSETSVEKPLTAVFIPFAAVTQTWPDYTRAVADALSPLASIGLRVCNVDEMGDVDAQHAALMRADLIIVGGGNTFQLLKECRERGFLGVINSAVGKGVPYLGWSAGANLAGPTIATTNDMPIVDPEGLDALHLVDFQLNPHYTNALPDGHRGESRDQRIEEFLVLSPHREVIGLPEGDSLWVDAAGVRLIGPVPAKRFRMVLRDSNTAERVLMVEDLTEGLI